MHPAVCGAVLAVASSALGVVSASPGAATPPPPTCRGVAATLVGAPGERQLRGTPGRDVIVSNGAEIVRGVGGDDLICLTGDASIGIYQATGGTGDDIVEVVDNHPSYIRLGTGHDTAIGSDLDDLIIDTDLVSHDDGHDTVEAGAGDDYVMLSGMVGSQVDLGPGDDTVAGVAAEHVNLSGGDGSDELAVTLPEPPEQLRYDNRHRLGKATAGAHVLLHWHDFEKFVAPVTTKRFTFLGGDAAETVSLQSFSTDRVVMGAGNDRVVLGRATQVAGPINGGPGNDKVRYTSGAGQIHGNIATQDLQIVDIKKGRTRYGLAGIESMRMTADQVTLVGDDGPNRLTASGCVLAIDGADGADILEFSKDRRVGTACVPGVQAIYGGPGDDALTGDGADNTLIGGDGRDRANGGDGTNTCSAEVVVACETPAGRATEASVGRVGLEPTTQGL